MIFMNNINENIASLFNEANERINKHEEEEREIKLAKERMAKEQAERRQRTIRETTENYYRSIVSLVCDTLNNAESREGNISISDYNNLGNPISNISLDHDFRKFSELVKLTHTGYRFTNGNSELHIILNYSRWGEGCIDTEYGGTFDDSNIDYDDLATLLNPHSIYVDKIERKYVNAGNGEREYIKFIEIAAFSRKDLAKEYEKTKCKRYEKYQNKHSY